MNGSEYHFLELLEDTSGYKCEIVFVLEKSVNAISKLRHLSQDLSIINSLPDHTINFTLPSSSHPETLFIYDILGREISKIEIPAGSTSYVLESAGFPKGTYFARLGSGTVRFMIM